MHRSDWIEYACAFCSSLTMSPTIILNGCMATLIEVSRNMSENSPNHMAPLSPRISLEEKFRLPAFGRKIITRTEIRAPIRR